MSSSLICTGARYRVDAGSYTWGRLAALPSQSVTSPTERREHQVTGSLPLAQAASLSNPMAARQRCEQDCNVLKREDSETQR